MQSALPGSPSITKAEYEPSSRGAESRLCSVVSTTALYERPSDWEMETRPWVTNGARSTSASCGGKLSGQRQRQRARQLQKLSAGSFTTLVVAKSILRFFRGTAILRGLCALFML